MVKHSIVFLFPLLAIAHHGFAEFDREHPVALEGTVTEFHYTNPHCIVDFDVSAGKGPAQHWQGELTSPLHLKGWNAASIEPGDKVSVSGYRARSGALYLWITKFKSSSGVELKTNGDNLIPR